MKPVALAHRPMTYVENMPAIIFTPIEEDQLCRQRENTLIMKFSAGKPRLEEIRAHIAATWGLEKPPAVGYLDPRHVTINMASPEDTKQALARPSNKIDNSLFRLFRWTPDFEIGKESSLVAVWVKFYNLPLHYYNEASLVRLGSILGTVLRVDTHTLDLRHQVYARVCIELDVTQDVTDKIWIGTSKEHGWVIEVEYEGNHAYCSYCGLLGHTIGLCRKKRQTQGKAPVDTVVKEKTGDVPPRNNNKKNSQWIVRSRSGTQQKETQTDQPAPVEILKKPGDGVSEATRQALKNVGLLSDNETEQEHSATPGKKGTHIGDIAHQGDAQTVNDGDGQEQIQQDAMIDNNETGQNNEVVEYSEHTPADKQRETKGMKYKKDARVITTPTKNRFEVLDTECELQRAFRNLQKMESANKLELVPIPEDRSYSDGGGTRTKVIMGVPRNRSEPTSDEDEDRLQGKQGDHIGTPRQRNQSSSEHNANPSLSS